MEFKEGDIVRIKENVGEYIEKGAVGRILEVFTRDYSVEPIKGYEHKFLNSEYWFVLESHIELYEGRGSEMKKEDLENGMVVEYRKGKKLLVVNDLLFGLEGFNTLENYRDDLTSFYEELDIVKVYEIKHFASLNKVLTNNERLKLLWERKETLYFDARKSEGFENNFNNFTSNHKVGLFECHGLTKEETKERGYDRHWTSDVFTTKKPKPLKIIDGRVE